MGREEKVNPKSVWYIRHVLKIADGDSGYFASNGVVKMPFKLHRLNLWRKFVLFFKRLFLWN
jgi:hypothetical protein